MDCHAFLVKRALLGIGTSIGDIGESGKWHVSAGFPYLLAINRAFGDMNKPGFKPTVGLGLSGPMVGAMYRGGPAVPVVEDAVGRVAKAVEKAKVRAAAKQQV
jgi:hypothetical protein